MEKNAEEITFAKAREIVEAALKGTAFENAPLEEYGGGDGAEDIKPFRISRKNGVNGRNVDLGATVFPEGGMLFWVCPEDGEMAEYETAEEAIEVFNK